MYYKKLVVSNTVIEFHNSWSGVETVTANGQTVSQKSSIHGTNHYFTLAENRQHVRYVLTSKVDRMGQVYLDLRRNGRLVYKNVLLQKGSRKSDFGPMIDFGGRRGSRQGSPRVNRPRNPYIRKENKAKKSGVVKMKDYQLEEALTDFLEAQKVDAKDPEIYFHLACIYSVLEKTKEGFEAIKNAKKHGFTDEDAFLNHDMLAYLRIHPAFEDFVESGYTEYDEAQIAGKPKNHAKLTAHSEYGTLESVFIKKVNDAFLDEYTVDANWEDLNYLGKPDLSEAISEYDAFIQLLDNQKTTIHYLPADYNLGMDSMYCRDASITTDAGMILCRMGKAQRATEVAASEKAFKAAGIKIAGKITAPATLEGGDVAWLDENTLAVGHGYRTNDEGFVQLKTILEPMGIEVIQVDLPHYKGPSDVFHLMSIFSPVDKDLAVVYSPLMPVRFRKTLIDRGYQLVEVPDEEFASMGCNVLAIAPRKCVLVSGNPLTQQRLEAAGCQVFTYKGTEISIKGGGGPTCLTRPVLRYR
ncbi:MAG: arginine deiminase family protein [Bacteroidota bacterium]